MKQLHRRLIIPILATALAVVLLMTLSATPAQAQDDEMIELTFTWNEPTERENGERMEPEEIGGYEFRFLEQGEDEPQTVVMAREDSPITSYSILVPEGEHEYSIAAFDTNGLYSDFVALTASVNRPSRPASPPGFDLEVIRPSVDRVAECRDDRPDCVVLEQEPIT